mgnify:CR=1 FL=1
MPYIFRNEDDGKYYLSAYCFKIIFPRENGIKEIYYPASFLNLVFHQNNIIYFVNESNELLVYKFDKDSYKNYRLKSLYSKKDIKIEELSKKKKKLQEDNIKEISYKLAKLRQETTLKSTYEILCDILKNDLKIKLMNHSNQIKEKISYMIKKEDIEFTCQLTKDSYKIDLLGI